MHQLLSRLPLIITATAVLLLLLYGLAFALAIALYVAAKFAELHDREMLMQIGSVSGHTVKHLLATVAALAITRRLVQRVSASQ